MSSSSSRSDGPLLRSSVVTGDPGASRLGKYELLRRLAVGGMGEVFLARQRGIAGFDRLVVVKRLLPEMAEKPELVSLFIDEAKIAANLSHPNIVGVLDFGFEDGSYFLSMEYVAGQNLARIADRLDSADTQFPISTSVFVVAEVLRGLEFAHQAKDADGRPLGIVHRDVSPHNVMVSFGGDVKLMDFGIAKAANKSHRTEAGVIRGKLSYMSPEQARGDELDARSDVFSMGIVLWEMTLGRRLFDGDGLVETIGMITSEPIPKPTDIDPDYPVELEWIVMSALERDLSKRATSAAELESALRTFLVHSGAHIDRERIGADVAESFPKQFDELSADELSAGTSSDAITRALDGTASVPAVAVADTQPEPEPEPESEPEPEPEPEPQPESESESQPEPKESQADDRSGPALAESAERAARLARAPTRWPLLAVAVLAAGAGVYAFTRGGDDPPAQRPVVVVQADAAPPRIVRTPVDASVSVADARPIDAATKVARRNPRVRVTPRRVRRKRPLDAGMRRTPPQPRPADAAPVAVRPKPKPQPGTLIVNAKDGWGTVLIDGGKRGRTPFVRARAAGRYTIKVIMAKGGGSFSASARVAPGKRTKCIVDAGRLACALPR